MEEESSVPVTPPAEEGTEGIERESSIAGQTSADSSSTIEGVLSDLPGDEYDRLYNVSPAVDFSELTLFLDTKFAAFEFHFQFYDVVFSLVFILIVAKLLWWVFWDFLFRGV